MPGVERDLFDLVESSISRPDWLGLVMDNRRLFDALQDGWLRPPPRDGSLAGVNAYLSESAEIGGNRISVRVQLDFAKLPEVEVLAFRDNRWQQMLLSHVSATDAAVFWPGALPLFSTRSLFVASEEQRIRLSSIGKRISNIDVPETSISCVVQDGPLPSTPPPELSAGLVIPETEDSMRGAISMALWAVPRIDPWLDLLAESLSSHPAKLSEVAAAVDASWWRFPPWTRPKDAKPIGVQERLWLGAVDALLSPERMRPRETADQIAASACRGGSSTDAHTVEAWRIATHEILRAEATIQHEEWRMNPVGLAIQLVLSRPEPTAFKTWFDDDLVNLPPAVAWSAAVLCGLKHGYRQLDTRFRGKQVQREVVAIQSLRLCLGGASTSWPEVSNESPKWQRGRDSFILTWGGQEIACKRWQERGNWYAADLSVDTVQREALAIAQERGWPCCTRVISLEEGTRSISGTGSIEASEHKVKTRGDVRVELLPGDTVEELLDGEAFARLVAVEPGRLPAPPTPQGEVEPAESAHHIPGLKLIPEFLTEAEEREILSGIDQSDWSSELKRRVQHYGWRYDYKSRQVDPSMHIGPLPGWANKVAQRLLDSGHFGKDLPDQVIVNEYCESQGITPHIDSPSSFTGTVATISLLETWEMEFRKRRSKLKVTKKLERRSATILTDEARYDWTHEIPKRKTEPGAVKPGKKRASRIPRHRRISLTFRKVIEAANDSRMRALVGPSDT